MLDFGHLPKPQNGTIDYFPGFSSTAGGSWEVWNKPKNCMFIRILCLGGGGGGASGFPSATTNARGGGGGGSSCVLMTVTIPAIFLPDRLYVSAGVGGRGGASSTSISNGGTSGVTSYVSIAPSAVAIYVVCHSPGGTNAAAASNSAGGIGAGGPGFTNADQLQAFQGHINGFSATGGNNGGAATGAVGSNINYPTASVLLSGGAGGGGGAGFAGGNITAPTQTVYNLLPTLTGGVAGSAGSTIGGNGSDGVELYQPLLATGGSGGGSSFDGTAKGGDGGDGGFGCGGGGGGAGGTDGGGAGGNGGPGLVVIHTW